MAAGPHVRQAYAQWLLLEEEDRERYRVPLTKAAFARSKNLNARTLRRWEKEDEDFAALLEAERRRQALGDGAGVVDGPEKFIAAGEAPSDSRMNPHDPSMMALRTDVMEFSTIKEHVVREAREGKGWAIDMYMKWWGKTLAEGERSGDESLAHLTDVDLAVGVLERLSDVQLDKAVALATAAR